MIYKITRMVPKGNVTQLAKDPAFGNWVAGELQSIFATFFEDDTDALQQLQDRFIDAACYRERLPTVLLDVPDILIQICSNLISPDKHFSNLDRRANHLPIRKTPQYQVDWDYGAKYMYSEPWQQHVVDTKDVFINRQFHELGKNHPCNKL
jgi:hypothetical protein